MVGGKWKLRKVEKFSKEVIEVVNMCLRASDRISMVELINHPYFQSPPIHSHPNTRSHFSIY